MGATPMLALVQFVRGRGAVAHQHYAEGFRASAADPRSGRHRLPSVHRRVGTIGSRRGRRPYGPEGRGRGLPRPAGNPGGSGRPAPSCGLRQDTHGRWWPATMLPEALYQWAVGADLANWAVLPGPDASLVRQMAAPPAPGDGIANSFARGAGQLPGAGLPRAGRTARQELRASGDQPGQRSPEAWTQLTPQELQIAQMAAAGETNRMIGERLYLSPRTVQSHLYRIFPKLGITARHQLRDTFA